MAVLRQTMVAVLMYITLVVICGLVYPAVVTILAQVFFPQQANGSMLEHQGRIVGSALIGQNFVADKYFWGRPSATGLFPYNAQASSGSNLGSSNPRLLQNMQTRIELLEKTNPDNNTKIPIDLVTTSASGLDPHISVQAALWQAPRIAKARNIELITVYDLIRHQAEFQGLNIFAQDRINVLRLNLSLDWMQQQLPAQKR